MIEASFHIAVLGNQTWVDEDNEGWWQTFMLLLITEIYSQNNTQSTDPITVFLVNVISYRSPKQQNNNFFN